MGRIKVLLVDDHPIVRQGLRCILETASDVELVGEAADGVQAVRQADELRPDVVLMDIRMPALDGLEATQQIKKEHPQTGVIVLTVYDNEALVVEAVRAGAAGYLLKDASQELILQAVRAVTSGGSLVEGNLLQRALEHLGRPEAPGQGELRAKLAALSQREQEVLRLLTEGLTNKEVAKALVISEETAKKHVQNLIAKLGVSDRTAAAVMAARAGIRR
ncbi:MAG: response regulator transcription factor [Chloroflexi bacterium]|nr:response regulator transcription factor [Chloroflexota bacterium]